MSLAWDAVYALTSPLWGAGLLAARARGRHIGFFRADRAGRWVPPPEGRSPRIWLHAASVGEVRSMRALVPALESAYPTGFLWITTQTRTGMHEACDLYPRAAVSLAPLDFTPFVRRALGVLRPDLLVLIEREWWPNLLTEAHRAGVPILHLGSRISGVSARRCRATRWIWRPLLARVARFGARDGQMRDRLVSVGCDPSRVEILGDLKVDALLATGQVEPPAWLAGWLGAGPVVMGVSTHPDEETLLLTALDLLHKDLPSARLVLAPRHPHRFGEVATLLEGRGCGASRWTERNASGEAFLLDAMGRLDTFYPRASTVCVGGTWAEVGGHNLLEPAAASVPVLFGPHTEKVAEQAEALLRGGGGRRAVNAGEVAAALVEWAGGGGGRAAGVRARETVGRGAGACGRALAMVRGVLGR